MNWHGAALRFYARRCAPQFMSLKSYDRTVRSCGTTKMERVIFPSASSARLGRTFARSQKQSASVWAHARTWRPSNEHAPETSELKVKAEAGAGNDEKIDSLLPFDTALSGLPFVHLTADEARRSLHGMALRVEEGIAAGWRTNDPVRMRDAEGHLIAVGFYDAASRSLRPRVVFSPEK